MRAFVLLAAGLALAISGCGSSSGVIERACRRDYSCNFLPQGTTVDQCIQAAEATWATWTDDQRSQAEELIDTCLRMDTCQAWWDCVNSP